jgi:hypothetical protein
LVVVSTQANSRVDCEISLGYLNEVVTYQDVSEDVLNEYIQQLEPDGLKGLLKTRFVKFYFLKSS